MVRWWDIESIHPAHSLRSSKNTQLQIIWKSSFKISWRIETLFFDNMYTRKKYGHENTKKRKIPWWKKMNNCGIRRPFHCHFCCCSWHAFACDRAGVGAASWDALVDEGKPVDYDLLCAGAIADPVFSRWLPFFHSRSKERKWRLPRATWKSWA